MCGGRRKRIWVGAVVRSLLARQLEFKVVGLKEQFGLEVGLESSAEKERLKPRGRQGQEGRTSNFEGRS